MAEPPLGVRRPSSAARVSGEVVRGLATTALIGAWLLAATACGGSASRSGIAPGSTAAAPTAGAVNDPCAAVTTTTPLTEVSLACQQVWSSHGVTDVPPANELALEHVPAAPAVANMTGGAVSKPPRSTGPTRATGTAVGGNGPRAMTSSSRSAPWWGRR